MSYGLIPEGPARRAVVFGGSNAHIFSDEAHGAPVNRDAARALMALLTSPEWSLKNNWTDSNPANLVGFETEWMKQRLEEIRFLEVTTADAAVRHPLPGGAGVAGGDEHHHPGDAAERAHRDHDGRRRRRTTRRSVGSTFVGRLIL